MTINKNSVEQINVALLDMDKKIKSAISNGISASDFKNLEASVDSIKRNLNETNAGLEPGKTYNINISGKAATATKATTAATANKVANALTVNGKTYDGSSAVDAGVQTVANGGTGVTTQADINKAFIGNLDVGTSDVTDGTEFVSSYASDSGFSSTDEGSLHTPYKRQFIKVWGYIKGKISSVLGLTKDNYGGTAATILDYVKGTPIKVRWGGPGINSAEWYPAFNADGSAIEPINRTNIHAGNADTVDNYHASQLWRSDGAIWNPNANVVMTPSGNGSEWSFDFRNKNGATGTYWQVWDENKNTLLKVDADSGQVSAPYGFVGNLSGKASTAETADRTVNDITIYIPFVQDSGQYVIPFGNIPAPTSTEVESPYNWDITGFFSIIRPAGHNGSNLQFEAGHGYSHNWTTYAYLDKLDFNYVTTSIKAFQYNGEWWLGLCINVQHQGYYSKMTITYSRGLPATPTCILYNSRSNGVANKEIYDSIQDIPSWWWRRRTIYNPTTFTQNVTAPVIQANNVMRIPIGAPSQLEDGCIWIER